MQRRARWSAACFVPVIMSLVDGGPSSRIPAAVRANWQALAATPARGVFDPEGLRSLPAPARRFLGRAIAPGAPLWHSARLTMVGTMLLKPGGEPVAMTAEQVLAPPRGLVWCARVGAGVMRISGYDRYFDGEGEMRWKLFGLVPVASASGRDVSRSAAGRVAGEAVFVPATLLPQFGTEWEDIDHARAAYLMQVGDERVRCELTVDDGGRLLQSSVRRWREAASGRPAGYHRFDVDGWADEQTRDGYTLPTRFRAGWQLGDDDEFPFFFAQVDSLVLGPARDR